MYIKLFGLGVLLFGLYIIYIKRHLDDDSLMLGSILALTGALIIIVGWLSEADFSKRK